jgi:hypothetical protein
MGACGPDEDAVEADEDAVEPTSLSLFGKSALKRESHLLLGTSDDEEVEIL